MKLKNIFRRKKPVADLQQRMFTAAQHNRLIDWPISYQRINGDLFEEYQTIILRCRNLAQNNENVIGLLRNLQRNVIGQTGFTLQSKADDLDIQQSQHAKRMMTTALYALGFNAYPESSIKSVKDGVATVTLETGLDTQIPCDAIVNAADMLPNTALLDGISVKETYSIGDCAAPFNIALAIRGGNDAGRAV